MVGQEHVIRALVNALDGDRLHHAFLFAGTRGVGKTTVARILAKCLNCEQRVQSTPCGECAACREIDEGRFVDLIEVDAASRTKVDDTREMLDNVQYTPTRGRYKVYLIDEVHMLSTHSFNALLKTLEEPPPHVKFLLATTDPKKLPVTVLSRCLQFNLKRLPADLIGQQLRRICESEGYEFEEASIEPLARAADGSMRDGLSLLDQAVAYAGGRLVAEDVRRMLGSVDRRQILGVLDALARGDAAAMMALVAEMDEYTPDYAGALSDMATLLQRAALAQAVPEALGADAADADAIRALAAAIGPEDVQLYYQIALLGRRDLTLTAEPRSGFEMTLLRMLAFRPADAAEGGGARAARPSAAGASGGAAGAPKEAGPAAPDTPTDAPPAGTLDDWQATLDALPLQGAARQVASHCLLGGVTGNRVTLTLDREHEHMLTKQQRTRIAEAFSTYLGRDVDLHIEVTRVEGETPARRDARKDRERNEAALRSLQEDPNVRALQDTFGAVLEDRSVKPLD